MEMACPARLAVQLKIHPCLSIGEDSGRLELFAASFDANSRGQGKCFSRYPSANFKGCQLIVLIMKAVSMRTGTELVFRMVLRTLPLRIGS